MQNYSPQHCAYSQIHIQQQGNFEQLIFSNDYVRTELYWVLRADMAGRFLKNMERQARLISLDKGFYIQRVLHPKSFTSSITVSHALASRRGISDYPEVVESYVFDGDFLKLVYLRKDGLTHLLEDIGFEDLFYESILLHVGVLKILRIGKSNVFNKALKKPDADSFIKLLMAEGDIISIEELQSRASALLAIEMTEDDL